MVTVSKEEFYAYIGPRDIVVSSHPQETLFKTRDGRLVGKTEGYLITSDVGDPFYKLTESANAERLKDAKHTHIT